MRFYISAIKKYSRSFSGVFIALIILLLIYCGGSKFQIVIAALIALIAAMVAHHSAFANVNAIKEKDEKLSIKISDNVILRTKILSAEFLSFIEHRNKDVLDHLSNFKKNNHETVSLHVIMQYKIKIPSDFNFVLENIDKVKSKEVIEAMAKILYLSGQLNHFVESISYGVELNIKIGCHDLYIPIKDLERISYWVNLLEKAAQRMYDAMKEIKPTTVIL